MRDSGVESRKAVTTNSRWCTCEEHLIQNGWTAGSRRETKSWRLRALSSAATRSWHQCNWEQRQREKRRVGAWPHTATTTCRNATNIQSKGEGQESCGERVLPLQQERAHEVGVPQMAEGLGIGCCNHCRGTGIEHHGPQLGAVPRIAHSTSMSFLFAAPLNEDTWFARRVMIDNCAGASVFS